MNVYSSTNDSEDIDYDEDEDDDDEDYEPDLDEMDDMDLIYESPLEKSCAVLSLKELLEKIEKDRPDLFSKLFENVSNDQKNQLMESFNVASVQHQNRKNII